jgi:uncharacterized protein YlxW (UPF0749 family)
MVTFLNIALLVLGLASTLAAFGGTTCKEGHKPIQERIIARGWILLQCLVLALGVGICKELYSSNQQTKKDAAADLSAQRAQSDANKRQLELQNKLSAAAQQAKSEADKRQQDLQNRLATAQNRVELANIMLELANIKLEAL